MRTNDVPLILRLAGLWLMWAAWCTSAGWTLSAFGCLDGWGHALILPVLLFFWWQWLKTTAPSTPASGCCRLLRLHPWMFRPLPLTYAGIVVLSFISGCLYQPWSFDAVTYRLPRLLYWWTAHHWYWIGTLDHRLDFSSCGFEWQMLPVIELTHSDRLLFLLNWIPFLLLPGLTFFAFHSLGVNGRSARRWMWLLPAGYCVALQASGVQNDGYTLDFLLASVGFAVAAFRSGRADCALMSVLAAALLTGAKLSNLPLILPLGVLLLPALRRVNWFTWRTPVVFLVALLCSFAPMALLSLKMTGDWSGDPTDQWDVRTHNPVGGLIANAVIFLNDAVQPPVLPISERLNSLAAALSHNAAPFMDWLKQSHHEFHGVGFGEMVYEGGAGLGFGICAYLFFLILGHWFIKCPGPRTGNHSGRPWAWRLAPLIAWISYGFYLMKLGSYLSARIGAPYYPLLIISIILRPRVAAFERRKITALVAALAALSVLPVLILTPIRPLFPTSLVSGMKGIAAKYNLWAGLRDNFAPLRNALPPRVTKLGYAGGFHDTSYGLWQPLGSREVIELGLPLGSKARPPADLQYAVVDQRGLKERYGMDLNSWCEQVGAGVVYEMNYNTMLDGHSAAHYESWYLVKLHR